MTDTFKLSGDYTTEPATGVVSAVPQLSAQLSETVSLVRKSVQRISLTVDTAVTVDLCGLTQFEVLVVKTIGGKVRVRLTSADGSSQAVPVDTLLAVISSSVPYTALDLTRVAGTTTTVEVFMGEKA